MGETFLSDSSIGHSSFILLFSKELWLGVDPIPQRLKKKESDNRQRVITNSLFPFEEGAGWIIFLLIFLYHQPALTNGYKRFLLPKSPAEREEIVKPLNYSHHVFVLFLLVVAVSSPMSLSMTARKG